MQLPLFAGVVHDGCPRYPAIVARTLPHTNVALPDLPAVTGVFMRLAQPIEFDAVDDLPVDLVFMLLSPVDAGADHLKALARVSRRLRDRTFLTKLRGAGSPDALYALFTADAARDAA